MRRTSVVAAWAIGALVASIGLAAEKAPQKVHDLTSAKLVPLAKNPVVIAAVRAENAKGTSLAEIKDRHKKWLATPGVDAFMNSLMTNDCAKTLLSWQKEAPYLVEIFVKDNQGANVAMTNKTTNYYHGDKDKFTKSFNHGEGAVFVSDVQFDESSQTYVVQVSVPVMDGKAAIGVIIFGIDLDKLK